MFVEAAEAPSASLPPARRVCARRALGRWHFQRRGRRGPGCGAGGRARLRADGALHNLVMKELLRVELPRCVPERPSSAPAMLPPAREGLRGDNILSKTLFLILPLALAQIRLRAAQISSGKPLKRFKMSFSQFEGFCLANPVQGRLQASRPLLCCWCSSRSH